MLAPCLQAHKTRIAYKEAQEIARQNIYEHMYATHHCHICAVKGCAATKAPCKLLLKVGMFSIVGCDLEHIYSGMQMLNPMCCVAQEQKT